MQGPRIWPRSGGRFIHESEVGPPAEGRKGRTGHRPGKLSTGEAGGQGDRPKASARGAVGIPGSPQGRSTRSVGSRLSTAGGISSSRSMRKKELRHRMRSNNAVHSADCHGRPRAPMLKLHLQPSERKMFSAILTLSALGVLVTAGWIFELLVHRDPPTRMESLMSQQLQLQRSTEDIRG